jgi:hypothetical protein
VPFELDLETQKRLIAQWVESGRALGKLRRQELADCSAQDHREAAWDMSQLGGLLAPDVSREKWSGLIDMQRWFTRLRERAFK